MLHHLPIAAHVIVNCASAQSSISRSGVSVRRCGAVLFFFFFFFRFFFQAEDGIRDLVRSRGLGDVYKRQRQDGRQVFVDAVAVGIGQQPAQAVGRIGRGATELGLEVAEDAEPVSYTHLTLPTSDLVEISVVAVSLKQKIDEEERN